MNNGYGIELASSGSNYIHHNNFINNNIQAKHYSNESNAWDFGWNQWKHGGNYWSDYTGVDVKSGANQDQPGSDGIGDTPYIISTNNTDNYPFLKPNGPEETT